MKATKNNNFFLLNRLSNSLSSFTPLSNSFFNLRKPITKNRHCFPTRGKLFIPIAILAQPEIFIQPEVRKGQKLAINNRNSDFDDNRKLIWQLVHWLISILKDLYFSPSLLDFLITFPSLSLTIIIHRLVYALNLYSTQCDFNIFRNLWNWVTSSSHQIWTIISRYIFLISIGKNYPLDVLLGIFLPNFPDCLSYKNVI